MLTLENYTLKKPKKGILKKKKKEKSFVNN